MTVGARSTLTYDVDNRILTATGNSMEWYGYNAGNKRVWKKAKLGNTSYQQIIYAYGANGQKVMSMTLTDASGTLSVAVKDTYLYFGGRMVKEGSKWLAVDRLGSIRFRRGSPGTRHDYWPYGEEKPSATAQGMEKFATYERDHTGLDYADQRYFTNTSGRFVTPDPAMDGLNWYVHAGGDPVNRVDPSGLRSNDLIADDGWNGAGCYNDYVLISVASGVAAIEDCTRAGGLWYVARPISWGSARFRRIWNLFDSLSPYIEDWDYADSSGSVFDVKISLPDYERAVAAGFQASTQVIEIARACPMIPPFGSIICGSLKIAVVTVTLVGGWKLLDGLITASKAPEGIGRPKSGVPTGTRDIDKVLDREQTHQVKDGIGAAPNDWVGIAPNGDVITGSTSGEAENHGPYGPYLP